MGTTLHEMLLWREGHMSYELYYRSPDGDRVVGVVQLWPREHGVFTGVLNGVEMVARYRGFSERAEQRALKKLMRAMTAAA